MAETLNYRASNSAVYYTWQKPLRVGRTIAGLISCLLLACVGGYCYARLEPGIFVLHYRVVAALVAAVSVGLLALAAVRYGKVRSPVLAAFIGALVSAVALYCIWLTWLHTILAKTRYPLTFGQMILRPMVDVRLVQVVNHFGTWTVHGDAVKGPLAWFYWIAEGCIIMAAGVLMPTKGVYSDAPDCRECGKQCVRAPGMVRFAADHQPEFITAVEARDFSAFAKHGAARSEDDPELSLQLMSCKHCGKTHVLTVNRIAWTYAPKTGRKVEIKPLVNQLIVTADEADQIKSLCGEIKRRREVEQEKETSA